MVILQNTKEMLNTARRDGYAVPAFNIHNMEQIQVIVETASEMRSPVILAVTPGTIEYVGRSYIHAICKVAAKENNIPIALHLDHHETYESIVASLKMGTKSVMFDGSHLSFEENIALTKKVVEIARQYGATVEAELGRVGGEEDDIVVDKKEAIYTDPIKAYEFVKKTGIDSLAVAIGNAHGLYKGEPKLDFELLAKIGNLVDIPLVLHGASGLAKEDIQKCISLGISKVNISTELKISFTQALREYLNTYPNETDIRRYMTFAKERMKEVVREKMLICNSVNRV